MKSTVYLVGENVGDFFFLTWNIVRYFFMYDIFLIIVKIIFFQWNLCSVKWKHLFSWIVNVLYWCSYTNQLCIVGCDDYLEYFFIPLFSRVNVTFACLLHFHMLFQVFVKMKTITGNILMVKTDFDLYLKSFSWLKHVWYTCISKI